METTKAIIENLLLVSDKPLTIKKVQEVLGGTEDNELIKNAFDELINDYKNRSISIEEVAMGYRFSTRLDYAEWVKRFFKIEKGKRLSPAAIEVLSIIAYRQPITKTEIDAVRGVDSGGVIRSILDKKLIRGMGRKKVIGKPLMYGTSNRFLEYFGLKTLSDLPQLSDLNEVGGEFPEFSSENSQERLSFPDASQEEEPEDEKNIPEYNKPENEENYNLDGKEESTVYDNDKYEAPFLNDDVEANENEETISEERDE